MKKLASKLFAILALAAVPGLCLAQDSGGTAAGTPTKVFGDSTAVNWPTLYANMRDLPLTNNAVSGTGSWRGTAVQFQSSPAAGFRFEQHVWAYGHNDLVVWGPSAAALAKVQNELRSYLVSVFSKTFIAADNSGLVSEPNGAWTTGNGSLGDKSSLSGLGHIRFTATPGLTQQVTLSGPYIAVHLFAGSGAAGGTIGNAEFYIDGSSTPVASYNGNGDSDGRSSGETFVSPITHAAVVLYVGPGSHTVKVKETNGYTLYIDGYATLLTPANAPHVKVMAPLRPLSYTVGCGCYSSADFDALDAAEKSVIAEFTAIGYDVKWLDSNAGFPSGGYANDNEHPNGAGQLFLASLASSSDGASDSAYGTWTPTITGMTGSPTVTALWSRHGRNMQLDIRLAGYFSFSGATLTLPPDFPTSKVGTLILVNSGTGAGIGLGLVNTDSKLYLPNGSAGDGSINAYYTTQ